MSEKKKMKTIVDSLSSCLSAFFFVYIDTQLPLFFFFLLTPHCWANFDLKSVCHFSLAVRFVSCGRGGLVQFECSNPSDFRIEADGVVYAAKALQPSTLPASPLLIKATDPNTQQQWVTQVRLAPPIQVKRIDFICNNILNCLPAVTPHVHK